MNSFDNTEYAFAYKSDAELKKAATMFGMMGNAFLLRMGLAITPWAIKLNLPLTKTILRNTLFAQFVGGETLEQTANVAKKLGKYGVDIILDYGVEGGNDGEKGYDHATDEFIRVINYASSQENIPFMSIKVTGLVRFGLLEKLDEMMNRSGGSLIQKYEAAMAGLDEYEKAEWARCISRMERISEAGATKNIGVLVDAEETWIQDPVDAAVMLMMDKYNKERPVVYNTIQLYRHDRLQFLKDCHEAAQQRGFVLGVKIVRGAYMEKERTRAAEKGYPSPIQPDKQASDRDYDLAVRFCIDNIERIAVVIASHNEESNLLATELMDAAGIEHNNSRVNFSQLYGMSDNITFNLANAGFNVSKYLPFGPIKDVVPYLMRRAQENSSVSGQTGRELGLIKKELNRRKTKTN